MNAPIEAHTCNLNGAKNAKVRLYPVEAHPLRLYTVQAHAPICGVIGFLKYGGFKRFIRLMYNYFI